MKSKQSDHTQSPKTLLKLPEVLKLVPFSQSSIYRLMAAGKFPKNVKLGARAVAWRESDIHDFIDGLGA